MKHYLAIPNTFPAWDYLNVLASSGIAANNGKFKYPLGATFAAYKANGTTAVASSDTNLSDGNILKVNKRGKVVIEYTIKRRATAPTVTVAATDYAYV